MGWTLPLWIRNPRTSQSNRVPNGSQERNQSTKASKWRAPLVWSRLTSFSPKTRGRCTMACMWTGQWPVLFLFVLGGAGVEGVQSSNFQLPRQNIRDERRSYVILQEDSTRCWQIMICAEKAKLSKGTPKRGWEVALFLKSGRHHSARVGPAPQVQKWAG